MGGFLGMAGLEPGVSRIRVTARNAPAAALPAGGVRQFVAWATPGNLARLAGLHPALEECPPMPRRLLPYALLAALASPGAQACEFCLLSQGISPLQSVNGSSPRKSPASIPSASS